MSDKKDLPKNIPQEKSANAVSMYKGQKSSLILVVGKSGRGKSTSLRNLDPTKTYLINVMGKLLPFQKGLEYSEDYNTSITHSAATICRIIRKISTGGDIDNVIIDDAQYIMAMEFFEKARVKGYDKFAEMGQNFWSILTLASKLRPGLKIYILAHEDDLGNERKIKTLGKMLEDKGCPEGLATIVLWAEKKQVEGKPIYYFATQSDGVTNAKSPMGMFPEEIPNDLSLVSSRIDEYYSGVPLSKSKINFKL